MARTIAAHIAVEPDGQWRVTIGDGGTRPASGALPASEARRLVEAVEAALSGRPRVMVPGEDQARTRAEEQAGALLLEALHRLPEPFGHLRELLGVATGSGSLARVVLDAPDAAVRALPWELLSVSKGAPPLEVTQQGAILRLLPGPPAASPPRPGGLVVWRWSPTPGDESCARLAAALDPLGRTHGFAVRDVPSDGALPPQRGPEILEVIAHGHRDVEAVGLRLGEEARDPGAAAARLSALLERCQVVVLAVCGGADATPRELDNVAGRLAASGARAIVAPLRRVGVEALERFLASFYAALAGCAELDEAVVAGRRALRAWGHPHPSCRWSNLALFVTDLHTLSQGPLLARLYRPEGWPRPGPEAAALLERAAQRTGADGFLGFEHILGALPEIQGGGDLVEWLRRAAPARLRPFLEALAQQSTQPDTLDGPPVPTPRVRAWAGRLKPDFELSDLAMVIAGDPDISLGLFGALPVAGDDDPYATVESIPPDELPLATGLTVFGGPEDGRRIRPAPGETVGRTSEPDGPDHALFQGTRLWDRKLSRDHLRWVGTGRVYIKRPAVRVRGGESTPLAPGEHELRLGDVLVLTPSTRLLGLA